MTKIATVTSSRADYGIYRPIFQAIQAEPGLSLSIIATGMHLDPQHNTVTEIREDGFTIDHEVAVPVRGDDPENIGAMIGDAIGGFAALFAKDRPDILMVLGDRYDMFAAAVASVPHGIPLAHVHGGELTLGAIDDALRHAITKMAHLHFTSTDIYARRVRQFGEEDWRVTVSGAPSLDNLKSLELPSAEQIRNELELEKNDRPILVTYHPATVNFDANERHVDALLDALAHFEVPQVFTSPNNDTRNQIVRKKIEAYVSQTDKANFVANLGTRKYFALLGIAGVMVGNSSSGIIEAASFKLPVVDIGDRQKGRIAGANVIHVDEKSHLIKEAIETALSDRFRRGLDVLKNPYGDGNAAAKIVGILLTLPEKDVLLSKEFIDQ